MNNRQIPLRQRLDLFGHHPETKAHAPQELDDQRAVDAPSRHVAVHVRAVCGGAEEKVPVIVRCMHAEINPLFKTPPSDPLRPDKRVLSLDVQVTHIQGDPEISFSEFHGQGLENFIEAGDEHVGVLAHVGLAVVFNGDADIGPARPFNQRDQRLEIRSVHQMHHHASGPDIPCQVDHLLLESEAVSRREETLGPPGRVGNRGIGPHDGRMDVHLQSRFHDRIPYFPTAIFPDFFREQLGGIERMKIETDFHPFKTRLPRAVDQPDGIDDLPFPECGGHDPPWIDNRRPGARGNPAFQERGFIGAGEVLYKKIKGVTRFPARKIEVGGMFIEPAGLYQQEGMIEKPPEASGAPVGTGEVKQMGEAIRGERVPVLHTGFVAGEK